jgi:hypothetical protein
MKIFVLILLIFLFAFACSNDWANKKAPGCSHVSTQRVR